MSRMGKKPIRLDSRVKVSVDGPDVTVTGPKGTLNFAVPDVISVDQEDGQLLVRLSGESRDAKAKHGMVRSILDSMVIGVTEGFKKQLEFQGVGYRGELKSANHLSLSVGLSKTVEYDVPEGVIVTMPDPTHIVVEGIDKQCVGQVAATLRGYRPPDPYQGKGIRYVGEQVTMKEGKTVG